MAKIVGDVEVDTAAVATLTVSTLLASTGNTRLGDAAGDKVALHGVTVTNGGQLAVQTLATAATIGTVKTAIQTLLANMKTKGIMATS